MAVDSKVDSSLLNANLTSLASAIRGRTGISGTMSFPTQMISRISEIAKPLELSTASDMNSKLVSSCIGNIYKYTGSTDSTYTNGELYEVTNDA